MPEKRTIRDITIEHRQRKTASSTSRSQGAERSRPTKKVPQRSRGYTSSTSRRRGGRRERRLMFSILLLIGLIAAIFLLTVFGKTKVIIVPEQQAREIDMSLDAFKDAGNEQLRFDVMVIEDVVAETVAATDSQQVERKASGQIVIFNENSSSQNLREETRFETPDGLIFKTALGEAVTVPAASDGKPGQVEVTVYAEEPGDEYNIGLTDFVIPGWREIKDSRFETQYARSKTEMTGGFVGTERSVDEAEKARVGSALQTALEQRLILSAGAQKTEDFIFFNDGLVVQINDVVQGEGDNESVELVQTGSLTAILFNKQELSRIIAEEIFDSYEGEPVVITNLDALEFDLANKEAFEATATEKVEFSLSGTPHFEWIIDEALLTQKLAGVHKKSFQDVLREFSGIKRAELSVNPFWKTKIADKPEKIQLELIDSKL